ncbi:porin family protein [Janthinobacterium agaricidamnosum]|uniref:porin family protein n=1 Tax=Janthinobacterium agaricidamnosum TaxID=55508 RepID=UPI000ADCAFC7|nr:porin family protein [Janthinobacterium agaricidamnosum]
MKKSLTIALLAASVLSSAYAADQNGSTVYVGTSIGKSSVSSHVVDEKSDSSFDFNLGYKITPNLSTEIFARSLSFRLFDGLAGDDSYYPDSHVGISLLGIAPLGRSFSAYGRPGIGRTQMKSGRVSKGDYSETDPSVGLGVSYALNNKWAFKLEATRFTKTKVTTTLAGVAYSF